jgi:two-component system cell cycle response regulator
VTSTPAFLQRYWAAPDRSLTDIGRGGEIVVARIRLALAIGISLIPMWALLQDQPDVTYVVPAVATIILIAGAAVVLVVVERGWTRPWLPFLTSLFDITIVSAIQVGYILIERGDIAANSRVTFPAYFLALLATCLRFDVRVCSVTGVAAIVQYATIAVLAANAMPALTPTMVGYYGAFDAGEQVGRVALLVGATLLATGVVDRGRELRLLSTHDMLTGLYNRSYFEERVTEELLRARRYKRPLLVAILDLDEFKAINDRFGHSSGDLALKEFAKVLREALRRTDIIGRYGGEEFAIAFPETEPAEAQHKLDQVRAAFAANPIRIDGRSVRITFSAGVAAFPDHGQDVSSLIECADVHLLTAKRSGRNRILSAPPVVSDQNGL